MVCPGKTAVRLELVQSVFRSDGDIDHLLLMWTVLPCYPYTRLLRHQSKQRKSTSVAHNMGPCALYDCV
jgi:hypothetical protein